MNEWDHPRESQSKKTDETRIEPRGIPVSGELRWRDIHEEIWGVVKGEGVELGESPTFHGRQFMD